MKELNIENGCKARQSGFTIIELVVVILLLGILTATALPRFMDVTDEAHAAVVDAVRGGLSTGVGLFRAQWVGKNQPVNIPVAGFGGGTLWANATSGYPADSTEGLTGSAAECLEIYSAVLQSGAPSAIAQPFAAGVEANIEAVSANFDFVITGNAIDTAAGTNSQTDCILYYVGQFKTGNVAVPATIPVLTYNIASGSIIASTTIFSTN